MKKEAEQLLVTLGQPLTGYAYLKSKPTFEEEAGKETVTIGDKKVPLNKKLLNYKKIDYYLFGDGDNGLSKCINQLQVNKDNYNAMINIASGYLGDILKYANEIIPDSIELIEALIIRTLNNINANSASHFKKYDREIEQSERDIQMTLSERQAKTLYDAENNKIISASLYPHRNMLGIETGTMSVSSGSLVNVDAEMSAHRYAANALRETNETSAKKTLDDKLCDMIYNELTTFAYQFEDILVVKREDIFEKIDYRSNDISNRPYDYLCYINKEKFTNEDFTNLKKVLKYYDILDNFINYLENDIVSKIYNLLEESKALSNVKNQDLYLYLTGNKNILESPIKKRIYSYYTSEIEDLLEEDYETDKYDIESAEEILSIVNNNKNFFNASECEKISKLVEAALLKNKKEQVEKRKEEKEAIKNSPEQKKKLKKRIIFLIIFIAIVVFWVIQYFVIDDTELYGQQLGEFLGVLIVVGIILSIKKFIKKMRGY